MSGNAGNFGLNSVVWIPDHVHVMLKGHASTIYSLVLVMWWACSFTPSCGAVQRPSGQQDMAVQGKLEGTVEVSFRIDAKGHVEILNLASTSPQLADYVIKKLSRIQLEKGDPQVGQIIKYRFVFKKQT
ncbi:MAG: energy transducer TonB [Flavobacteriales bacterium]